MSECTTKSQEYFDLENVYRHFSSCLVDDQDVLLEGYLEGYSELRKFCMLLGSGLGYVGDEITDKSNILIELRKNDQNNNFKSLRSMIQYEMESKLLHKDGYVSGSRTLLRLHRGLDFIRNFLSKLPDLKPSDHSGTVAKKVYSKTLGTFHPWYIRFGANIAMGYLPARDTLLRTVCGDGIDSAIEILPKVLDVTNEVYNRTQNYYKSLDLLDLP